MNVAVLGAGYSLSMKAPLEALGLSVVLLPPNPSVDSRLQYHTDLSLCKVGNTVFCAPYLANTRIIDDLHESGLETVLLHEAQATVYPRDCGLNAAVNGKTAIINPRTINQAVLSHLISENYDLIHVKQGYSNCNTLFLNGHSLITEDKGIYQAASQHGLDVLLITPGSVLLNGFTHGFIGGASFVLQNTVCFTGNATRHGQWDRIQSFICEAGLNIKMLCDGPLYDIGGVLVL